MAVASSLTGQGSKAAVNVPDLSEFAHGSSDDSFVAVASLLQFEVFVRNKHDVTEVICCTSSLLLPSSINRSWEDVEGHGCNGQRRPAT